MFCRQCEQTAKGEACTISGVCGKKPEVAVLQDILNYVLKGISVYANLSRGLGVKDKDADTTVREGLFTTITNVNFSSEKIAELIDEACEVKEKSKKIFFQEYKNKKGNDFTEKLPEAADFKPQDSLEKLIEQGREAGYFIRQS
jgi:hydroxylamine reductase